MQLVGKFNKEYCKFINAIDLENFEVNILLYNNT
jgi:hypothetical protein